MQIKINELESLVKKALKNMGYSSKEINLIKDVLFYAQLRGNNQGIVKLIGKGMPKSAHAGEITVEKETKLATLVNGNYNQGMVVLSYAMEKVLKRVKKHGFGMAGTFNTSSSTGAIGYYANKIAQEGYIAFVFAGSPETVSTHGSYEPIFGTNPLAIGIPTTAEPLVLDMATASIAYFGLIEAATSGRSIPEGLTYDEHGNLTTDPKKALEGAIRPFDRSYKGAGLAMMVEILTGPLVRASFTGIGDTARNWGNLLFAIDPSQFVEKSSFEREVSQLIEKVKATKKLPNVEELFVPGERGSKLAKQRLAQGYIEVEDNLLQGLRTAAK